MGLLIEAMALGVPIVSTAVMGTATVLEGAASARTSAQDVPAFANQVATLLRDPALRREMSAAGPRDAQAWSAPILMQRAIELYERLVDEAVRAGAGAIPRQPPAAPESIR